MQHLSGLERARAALERGSRFHAGGLTPEVAESWQRCRDLGLDPGHSPRDVVIPFVDVQHKREANANLRRLALAEMQLLHSQIAGSNFMIALGDRDGVVLDTISDQRFADSSEGRTIIPGSVWDERERGTNALGLAVKSGRPIAVYGREHYFSCHGHLSCVAAPILDAHGQIIGLIDASCSHEARQQHTHALVRMAAAQIENGLIFQERSGYFILAFHPRVEYLDTLSAGLIAVSLEGEICSLNRPGAALLAGLTTEIGGSFDSLFEVGFGTALEGLLGGGVMRIRDRAGSGVFMVCRQIGKQGPVGKSTREAAPKPVSVPGTPDFICEDPVLQRSMRDLEGATRLRMPVHITGETGTGKELMARYVHTSSGRNGEFVAVNCGAVPEALFISEIFGHERGAFTNARTEGAPGLACVAHGGTLFFDEVADIPLSAQTALLRFLDSMEVRAVGGQKTRTVDVQIVSATNRNLQEMVAAREFRADLLYRLNAYTVRLPSLDSRADFPLIVQHLIHRMAPDTAITDAAIAKLSRRRWPGNIRELQAVLQRALVRRNMEFVDEDSFEDGIPDTRIGDCCEACQPHVSSRHRCVEIRATYQATDRNVSKAARILGLSRTTVYKHVIDPPPAVTSTAEP